MVTEWRHSGRHSDRSMDAIDRLKEAQWWDKGGIAHIHMQFVQQYAFYYGATNGRPLCILSATFLQSMCLPAASFERPVSDRPPPWPLCDCFEHALNFTTTMASMARSKCPLCDPWTTKATFQLPLCLQRRPGQFLIWSNNGGTKVAFPKRNGYKWKYIGANGIVI